MVLTFLYPETTEFLVSSNFYRDFTFFAHKLTSSKVKMLWFEWGVSNSLRYLNLVSSWWRYLGSFKSCNLPEGSMSPRMNFEIKALFCFQFALSALPLCFRMSSQHPVRAHQACYLLSCFLTIMDSNLLVRLSSNKPSITYLGHGANHSNRKVTDKQR